MVPFCWELESCQNMGYGNLVVKIRYQILWLQYPLYES